MRSGRSKNNLRRTRGEVIFDGVNVTLLVLFSLTCLLPMINLFAKAVSSESMVISGKVLFWPREFQLESLGFLGSQYGFHVAFINTVFVTIIGTALNILFTILAAYPLSRKRMRGRRLLNFAIIFTMLFTGGLIPTFILVQQLGLINNLWSLIWPRLTSPFFIIILRNFFEGIPDSLEESAKIDGASHTRTLISIMLPLSVPCIATLVVFYAVGHWNNYFEPLFYIQKRESFTLQLYLRRLLDTATAGGSSFSTMFNASQLKLLKNKSTMIVQASAVFLSTAPIMLVYPFLQRYFVRGMTLGAVKG